MARPKEFERRIHILFSADAVSAMKSVAHGSEDRSDFIRAAVETELAIRKLISYDDLLANLTANETIPEFCARAVKRAVLQRKAALGEPNIEEPTDPD